MTKRKIDDPAAYLESLWGLHDAVVDGLTVLGDIDTVRLDIDDLNKAFLGEADRYPGPQPAQITLSGVRSVLVDLAFPGVWISRARISRCHMEPDEPLELTVDIKGAAGKMPGGWPSIQIVFEGMEVELLASGGGRERVRHSSVVSTGATPPPAEAACAFRAQRSAWRSIFGSCAPA